MNAADLTAGATIDRYTVLSVLGEGGMAIVYKVEHAQLGSMHALKVLTLSSRQVRERLLQEGRAQATLRHPNVVTVTDVIDLAGAPGLVMEYIEGPCLDDFLQQQRLTVQQADALAQGILAGVAAAHDAGLVHRDLKPANIMLAIGSGGLVPKVTDFGLAKIVKGDGKTSKTRTGSTMGTPHYMSPEQIADSKNVGPATDIWALGAILYEMLTGERAFPGDNLLEIFRNVDDGEYVPVQERNPEVPDRMARAIDAALQQDATQRPATVQALQAVWNDASAEDGAAAAAPMGPWDASSLASARSMATQSESAAPSASPATTPELSSPGGTLPGPTEGPEAAPARSSDSLLTGSKAAIIGVGGGLLGIGGATLVLAVVAVIGGAVWWWSSPGAEPQPEGPVPVAAEGAEPGDDEVPAPEADAKSEARPRPGPREAAPASDEAQAAAPRPRPGLEAASPPDKADGGAADPSQTPPSDADDDAQAADSEDGAEADDTEADGADVVAVDPDDGVVEVEDPAPDASSESDEAAPVDTGSVSTSDGVQLSFGLQNRDPEERMASLKRQAENPDDNTSRAIVWILKNDTDSRVRQTAFKIVLDRWEAALGDWYAHRDGVVWMATYGGARDAEKAAEAFGAHGEDPRRMAGALKHHDPSVRLKAIDAMVLSLPRAKAGTKIKDLLEPLTNDADNKVARRARKLVAELP